jgi:release factor glutamine methyltransferase
MTRREAIAKLVGAAEPVYGRREAESIARLVAEKRWGLSRADCALRPEAAVDAGADFESILGDLGRARPVQYILGTADFDGLEIAVGEGVLVPRPETEELVRWVAGDWCGGGHGDGRPAILDIGTGSGAIAIALARRLPEARVTAIDVSPEALRWARENNVRTGAGVEIVEADIFDWSGNGGRWDVIVSNPPYIPAAERAGMARNVVGWEPGSALFVPDDDPLVFYRAVARFSRRHLTAGGALYFEIHESAAGDVARLLLSEGFEGVDTRRDINDKPRMIRCTPRR